jgi:thiamine-monophosphate kinase
MTCDLLAEGVHFNLKHTTPWELGARTAAVNLSDLASMGAQPRLFLVSVALPRRAGLGEGWLRAFHQGLHAYMAAFGAQPAGGDLSSSKGGVFIDLTALGEVERGKALRRSAARPGDGVWISGPLGGSAAGLEVLSSARLKRLLSGPEAETLRKRHLLPTPKVLAGRWLLQERLAHACVDISDGLASESWHLSRESGVRIELEADAVPLEKGVAKVAQALGRDPLAFALSGGEDYELLFTAPAAAESLLAAKMGHYTGCEAVRIGRVVEGEGVRLRQGGRLIPLPDHGYDHFKS